jgi:hypothetical protein
MNELVSIKFVAIIPLSWCGLLWVVSRQSGRSRLAQQYRATDAVSGETAWMRTGRIGVIHYHSCLCFGVNEEGLRIAIAFPFRFFHPPLFIGWDQFHQISADPTLYSHKVRMSVGRSAIATLMMPAWVRYRLPLEMRP